MIKVGIIGSAGYVAGELLRCLIVHPEVEINFLYSKSQGGKKVSDIHKDQLSNDQLKFSSEINTSVDVVFLCLGHGNSKLFLQENTFLNNTKIIDLSNDFRLDNDASFNGMDFIYGMSELGKQAVRNADFIANPGCFASAIQYGLLPLAKAGLIKNDVHINAITGSTGAGQSLSATSHFSWRNNNMSIYKAFNHQHLGEIKESLISLQPSFDVSLDFLPIRGDFTRGIFASMYTKLEQSEEEVFSLYKKYYAGAQFITVTNDSINLKQVVNTNNCYIQIQKIDGKLLITSVIDNLIKGAAGQAIQNMNLMFGIEETTGLNFKASYF